MSHASEGIGKRWGAAAVLAAALLAPRGFSAGVDEFPRKTEDGWVLEPEKSTLRLGLAVWEEDEGPDVQEWSVSYGRGFADGFELGFLVPYVFSDPPVSDRDEGVNNLRLYAEFDIGRHLFFEWENPVNAISFAFTLFPDTGKSARKLELYERQAEATFNFSKDLEWSLLHASFGAVWYDDEYEPTGQKIGSALLARAGIERSFVKGSSLFGEILWQEHPDSREETDPTQLGAGLRFPFRSVFQFDAGAWVGLSDTAPELQVAVGVGYLF